jgi:hypothetical protein
MSPRVGFVAVILLVSAVANAPAAVSESVATRAAAGIAAMAPGTARRGAPAARLGPASPFLTRLVARPGTTPTTVGGIRQLPRPTQTIPFTTRKPNAHVSPIYAELSVGGVLVFLLLVATQVVLTRPGRRGRRTL